MPTTSMSTRVLRESGALRVPSTLSPPSICPRCLIRLENSHLRPARRKFSTRSKQDSAWAAAVAKIQDTVSDVLPTRPNTGNITIDPLKIVGRELKFLNKNIRQLLGSGHPILDTVAKYYTQSEGKHVRPLLVLLMSRATAFTPKQSRHNPLDTHTIDTPISSPSVLYDNNPDQPSSPLLQPSHETKYAFSNDESILPSQRRLAEITELIHTASLLHDDVIDTSTTRRGSSSANTQFGNKMAVLAGDFLLGRASVALARLRDPEVIELLATVIANLVEGEFMQLKNTAIGESNPRWSEETITYYLQKTYLKSASLISKSCRAAALLGECAPGIVEAAYAYGRNLGLAFQLVDDMLDYTVSGSELGKPAGADLELGLATAPLLFAWRSRPELGELVGRRFDRAGDVQRARDLVVSSDGIEQTRALAQEYADKALSSIASFPNGEAKDGLEEMRALATKLALEAFPFTTFKVGAMASGPHTFVTTVVFSPTKFEGSRHLVVSPRGPPNQPPLVPPRKARIAAEFNLPSATYIYDSPAYAPNQPSPRRLEIYKNLGGGKGIANYGWTEVGFEPGAILAAAQYLCTYIDRSPLWSHLPRGPTESEHEQHRLSFYLPTLQEHQRTLHPGQASPNANADGRVNVVFNPYRQVAAVAVPSLSSLFKVHKQRVPLKHILDTQPQVKIVPELEELKASHAAGCPVVSLGRDMHFILVDVSAAPTMLAALIPSPGAANSLDDHINLDDEPGWGASGFQTGLVGSVWYIRGKKDEVKGEATIEKLRCRVFGDVSAWEEEGLGSAAAALGGWLSVSSANKPEANPSAEELSVEVEALKVEDSAEDAEGGAEVTPIQSAKDRVERKVFGVQTGVEMGRNSTIAVEVDVLVDKGGKRRLGGMVVSGRANFETKGELLGS